jgi:hypothetical protein
MFTKALLTGVTFAIATTAASMSFGGTCEDVNIVAHNKTGSQIKVIDMYYRTYDANGKEIQKREEAVKNRNVNAGNPFTTIRNLEGADGLLTKLYVEYRVRKKNSGFDQWTGVKRQATKKISCYDGRLFEFDLKKR